MKSNCNAPKVGLSGGLSIGYQSRLAVADGDIELGSGTHYLLARNGRGKTTLLRTLAGVIKPIDGGFACEGRCQLLSEDLAFDRELPARIIFKSLLDKSSFSEAMMMADELELDTRKPYGKLSTGNKRKVALLVAEFSVKEGRSDILLLDEPFTGLDAFAREVFQNLWDRRQDGVLRLVSCHPDFDSMKMDSSVLISEGKIVHLHGENAPKQWGDLKTQLN